MAEKGFLGITWKANMLLDFEGTAAIRVWIVLRSYAMVSALYLTKTITVDVSQHLLPLFWVEQAPTNHTPDMVLKCDSDLPDIRGPWRQLPTPVGAQLEPFA